MTMALVLAEEDREKWMHAYLRGEMESGTGGILLVRNGECAYIMPNHPSLPEPFREQLAVAMDQDDGKSMFFVEEKNRTLKVHSLNKLIAAASMAGKVDELITDS